MKPEHPESVLSSAISLAFHNTAKLAGIKSPPTVAPGSTLAEIERATQAAGLRLDGVLADAALTLANGRLGALNRDRRNGLRLIISDLRSPTQLVFTKGTTVSWSLTPNEMMRAVHAANRTIEIIHDLAIANNVPIFQLLGLRNLSSFVGEIYARELCTIVDSCKLMPNPNQDGYPDLCALTPKGKIYVAERKRKGETCAKQFWSPYPYGGVEIKGTCGNTPAASKFPKPQIGESRYSILTSAEWKAHHRETNNLAGIFWDFLDGLPTVLAVFFRNDLSPCDWGEIVQPKAGGGRTTSVSIMTRDGVKKMGQGWVVLPEEINILKALRQDRVFGLTDAVLTRNSSHFVKVASNSK